MPKLTTQRWVVLIRRCKQLQIFGDYGSSPQCQNQWTAAGLGFKVCKGNFLQLPFDGGRRRSRFQPQAAPLEGGTVTIAGTCSTTTRGWYPPKSECTPTVMLRLYLSTLAN